MTPSPAWSQKPVTILPEGWGGGWRRHSRAGPEAGYYTLGAPNASGMRSIENLCCRRHREGGWGWGTEAQWPVTSGCEAGQDEARRGLPAHGVHPFTNHNLTYRGNVHDGHARYLHATPHHGTASNGLAKALAVDHRKLTQPTPAQHVVSSLPFECAASGHDRRSPQCSTCAAGAGTEAGTGSGTGATLTGHTHTLIPRATTPSTHAGPHLSDSIHNAVVGVGALVGARDPLKPGVLG